MPIPPEPLAVDLFCGLGGWTEGLLAEGYYVVGFDNERHVYGDQKYPAQLVLQDVLTIHGKQFKDAALIVASPPCQAYSYMAMPWSIAKQKAREYEDGTRDVQQLTALFDACFRIQREATEAAGHFIPLVVENVRGAQKWVGRSKYHFGSFHLWGDVPALMPPPRNRQTATKVAGMNHWSNYGKPGYKAQAFNGEADRRLREAEAAGLKGGGGTWFGDYADGIKQGGDWFNDSQPSISRRCSSKSKARKRASAMIAKIPLVLSRHIARAWYPVERQERCV